MQRATRALTRIAKAATPAAIAPAVRRLHTTAVPLIRAAGSSSGGGGGGNVQQSQPPTMSMFYDEFDRLQDTVNALMGDFSQRRGRGGRQQRRGGWMDPLGMFDEDWMTTPLTTAPLLTGDVGSTGSLLPAGGKGLEESKMDESGAGGQLTTTGGEQRVGLPTLRCRVNVEDQKDKLVVTAEVPGFDKNNLKVHIDDNNILSISGEQKQEHVEEAKNKRYLRVERSFGQIQRQLRLPRNINAKGVQASYQNGILHIDVPKVDLKETQTPVNIQ